MNACVGRQTGVCGDVPIKSGAVCFGDGEQSCFLSDFFEIFSKKSGKIVDTKWGM